MRRWIYQFHESNLLGQYYKHPLPFGSGSKLSVFPPWSLGQNRDSFPFWMEALPREKEKSICPVTSELKPLYFSKSHHLFDITMVCTEHCVAFVLIGVLCQFQPRLDSFFSGTLTKSNLIFPMKWHLVHEYAQLYLRTESRTPASQRYKFSPDEKHQKSANSLHFSSKEFKRSNSFPLRSCPFPDLSWERRMQEFILNYIWLLKTTVFSILRMNKTEV